MSLLGFAKRPVCPRCKGRLRHGMDIALDGCQEYISCMVCGWRLYREPAPSMTVADVKALESDAERMRRETFQKIRVECVQPCKVRGCGNVINRLKNITGLCGDCHRQLYAWKVGKRTTPPPFVKVGSEYVRVKEAA